MELLHDKTKSFISVMDPNSGTRTQRRYRTAPQRRQADTQTVLENPALTELPVPIEANNLDEAAGEVPAQESIEGATVINTTLILPPRRQAHATTQPAQAAIRSVDPDAATNSNSNNNGIDIDRLVEPLNPRDYEDVLQCPICLRPLLLDDKFADNDSEVVVLKGLLQEKYTALMSDRQRKLAKGKQTKKKLAELEDRANREFCRFHVQFELDVNLKNNGCPQLSTKLPRMIELNAFENKVKDIIVSKDFQDMISSGQSRFKGMAQRILHDLREDGYQPIFAQMALATRCAARYIPGYYRVEGAEAIVRVANQQLSIDKLASTPWALDAQSVSTHFDLLRHTMMPDIAFCLIQEDSKAIFTDNDGFEDATIERIMGVTANSNYALIHVELEEDE